MTFPWTLQVTLHVFSPLGCCYHPAPLGTANANYVLHLLWLSQSQQECEEGGREKRGFLCIFIILKPLRKAPVHCV